MIFCGFLHYHKWVAEQSTLWPAIFYFLGRKDVYSVDILPTKKKIAHLYTAQPPAANPSGIRQEQEMSKW